MTDAEFTAWLESDTARRVVLLEIGVNSGGSETTRYVASRAYITAGTDTPASTYYEARVAGGVAVQESLGITGGAASLSYSDIQLINSDGGLDSWLSDVFTNRALAAYLGDESWPKADFRQIYAGTIDTVDSPTPDRIVIRLGDKMQRLSSALTETKLGGTTPNADALIPLCFGECHNIAPLLTNPGTLEYAVHDGPIELIIEVRDNGVPVSFTPNLATGRFTLAASPVGTITASVQGWKPSGTYYNNVGDLISLIVRNYGRSDMRLALGDIDTANFSAFVTANPQPVGLYVSDSMSVRYACEQLAASVGAKLVMSRTGLLRLVKIALPPASTAASVTDSDIPPGSLRIAQRAQVAAACKLAYCRNWTVQEAMQSGVVAQHKELYAQEWLTVTASDAPTATLHRLPVDVQQEETLLLATTDANAEASRRLALRSVQRNVYEFDGTAKLLMLEIGNGISLTSRYYALSAGISAQVVSLQIDWVAGLVKVGALR